MVLTTLHFLHDLAEDFLREREEGIFNPGNTVFDSTSLTILLILYLWQQIPEAFADTRASCEGDVLFAQVAALTLCPIVVTI